MVPNSLTSAYKVVLPPSLSLLFYVQYWELLLQIYEEVLSLKEMK